MNSPASPMRFVSTMTNLRLWMAAMLVWLLAFYNIERLVEPINLASFVYVLGAGVAIALIVAPRLQKASLPLLVVAITSIFLVLKAFLGYPITGASLPITITEICTLLLTAVLARRISAGMAQFERGAADMMTIGLCGPAASLKEQQTEFYREIRRARRFHRPLTLMAIKPTGPTVSMQLNRFIEQVQAETISKYVNGRLADLLISETKDCDVVAHHDGHFVVMLPEIGRRQAEELLSRLTASAGQKLGLTLQAGIATFPEQEVTLTGLLERAAASLKAASGSQAKGDKHVHGAGNAAQPRCHSATHTH